MKNYICLLLALLVIGSAVAQGPELRKEFPIARLVKGDKFKIDLGEHFAEQNIEIQGNKVITMESRFGPAYREINAPSYTYKDAAAADKIVNMNNCLMGSISNGSSKVICGTKTDTMFWHFEMNDNTNTLETGDTKVYARFLGKDAAEVASIKIERCDQLFDSQQGGQIAVCVTSKSGTSEARDIKIAIVHIAATTAGGQDPYKGIRVLLLDQVDVKLPYFFENFALQELKLGDGNFVYLMRKTSKLANKTDRSMVRIFKIGNILTGGTLTQIEDGVVNLEELNIDTATTPTKFGGDSEIMTIYNNENNKLRFAVRVKDASSVNSSTLRFFHLNLTRDTVKNEWVFAATDVAIMNIPTKNPEIGSVDKAIVVFYNDNSSGSTVEGFYLITMDKVSYNTYTITAGTWAYKPGFFRPLTCLTDNQGYVLSVSFSSTLGYNVKPDRLTLFVSYDNFDTSKKIAGYANYNLLTNRYSCNSQKKTELEQMVSW